MSKKYVEILTPILAVLTALIIGGIIIQLNGVNAFEAYGQLFKSAFYQANPKAPFMSGLAKTLLTATPMIFVGLSVMVAFKAGLFNIGAQGQMIMGGMAAATVGIYVKNVFLGNFVVAIIAAGIGGSERVLGGTAQYAYTELIMGELGFTGVAVALLGKSNPIGVFIAAIFYASLEIGGQSLQSMKIPKEVVYIIQALIIIFVAGENLFRYMLSKRGGKKQ